MSGQPSYTETIKLELQLADIQSQLTQRTAELEAAKRLATNAQWQIDYLLDEAKKAFELTDSYTPSDLVDCVLRPASSMLKERDELKAELERVRAVSNPCSKIFTHKWLDPECVENGCQSLKLKHRQGMEG